MEIIVVPDPDISEIREMLDCVERAQLKRGASMRDILPDCPSYEEYLKAGWCYLWYDADTLNPVGYTLFIFEKRKERFPLFLMGGTEFCELRHIMKIRRAMLAVMRGDVPLVTIAPETPRAVFPRLSHLRPLPPDVNDDST